MQGTYLELTTTHAGLTASSSGAAGLGRAATCSRIRASLAVGAGLGCAYAQPYLNQTRHAAAIEGHLEHLNPTQQAHLQRCTGLLRHRPGIALVSCPIPPPPPSQRRLHISWGRH